MVIIGFAAFETINKRIYDYHDETTTVTTAKNISPYLVAGSDLAVASRSNPICNVPACEYGNKPTDGGFLIVEESDRKQFLAENPAAKKYLRPLLCAEEYLYAIPRWCLWLVDASATDIRSNAGIKSRVDGVRGFRLASKKEATRCKADDSTVFAEIRQPTNRYIVIPQHTSETRKYVPFGYFGPNVIVHNSCSAIPDASLFHFGVLSSAMHMAWVRQICGRLESRYRYSTRLVYNNYPWPASPTAKQRALVEKAAQAVLEVRDAHLKKGEPLADLYDPISMPSKLVKAHSDLDRAVDLCYRPASFPSERQRVEFLFALYEQLTAPLMAASRKPKRKPPTS